MRQTVLVIDDEPQIRRVVRHALENAALSINFVKRSVHLEGALNHLTPTEWGLLRVLATHPDQTMTLHNPRPLRGRCSPGA